MGLWLKVWEDKFLMAEMVSRAGNLMMAARVLETEGVVFFSVGAWFWLLGPPKKAWVRVLG